MDTDGCETKCEAVNTFITEMFEKCKNDAGLDCMEPSQEDCSSNCNLYPGRVWIGARFSEVAELAKVCGWKFNLGFILGE